MGRLPIQQASGKRRPCVPINGCYQMFVKVLGTLATLVMGPLIVPSRCNATNFDAESTYR